MISVDTYTKKEEKLLTNHYKKAGSRLIRERAHAMMLSNKGYAVYQIAEILFRDEDTVRNWKNNWNNKRMSSIFTAYTGNTNASKFTKEQKEEIRKTINKPPHKQGLPGTFWLLPQIKQYLKAEFGVVYESDRSYHYLLKYSGYSWKLPSPFDIKRDETQIKKRMKEIREEIKPYMEDDNWVVLTADETRINWEEEVRRAWLKRNKKTVIKLSRNKTGQSYFGALNIKTGKESIYPLDWQNTENIIKVVLWLIKKHENKKLCIIWDNASWHKSKELRNELMAGGKLESVHLINFPPYAPDMNPEEHVWKYGKENIANTNFNTFEAMKESFTKLLNNKMFDYKMPEFVLR